MQIGRGWGRHYDILLSRLIYLIKFIFFMTGVCVIIVS